MLLGGPLNMLEVHDSKKGVSLKEHWLKIRGERYHSKIKYLSGGGGVGVVGSRGQSSRSS